MPENKEIIETHLKTLEGLYNEVLKVGLTVFPTPEAIQGEYHHFLHKHSLSHSEERLAFFLTGYLGGLRTFAETMRPLVKLSVAQANAAAPRRSFWRWR